MPAEMIRNKVSIVGVGNTPYGNFPETDEYGLAAHAFRNAIEDCGLDKDRRASCRERVSSPV